MIEICIGSACHLKGSYQVIQKMKELLDDYQLAEKVVLKSSFCLGACGQGVSIRLNGEKVYSVDADKIECFFKEHILGDVQ